MDPLGLVPLVGLAAFLYTAARQLAGTADTDTPSLGASILGAIVCATLLAVLLLT